MSSDRQRLGAAGELVVAQHYERLGYRLIDQNWRSRHGEVDLIVALSRVVVFCEVKTRRGTRFGLPSEAVTPAKQLRIRRLSAEWLNQQSERWSDVRFDVASVDFDGRGFRVDLLTAAF